MPTLEIDPSAPGTIVRTMLALESATNLFLVAYMLFTPRAALSQMWLADTTAAPSNEALTLVQWFALPFLAVTEPLVAAIPNRPGAVEKRAGAYAMMATLEAAFVALAGWQILFVGEGGTGMAAGKVVASIVAPAGGFLVYRLWVLWVRPDWMGRYRVKRE